MNQQELLEALGGALRIVVVGGPDSGKSTIARAICQQYFKRPWCGRDALPLTLYATDDLRTTHDWSETSATCAEWLSRDGGWVIEGVATARGLRKWLAANPEAELNAVIVLTGQALVEQTPQQCAMGKGVATVWNGIALEVLKRGARVLKYDGPTPEQVREAGEAAQAPAAQ